MLCEAIVGLRRGWGPTCATAHLLGESHSDLGTARSPGSWARAPDLPHLRSTNPRSPHLPPRPRHVRRSYCMHSSREPSTNVACKRLCIIYPSLLAVFFLARVGGAPWRRTADARPPADEGSRDEHAPGSSARGPLIGPRLDTAHTAQHGRADSPRRRGSAVIHSARELRSPQARQVQSTYVSTRSRGRLGTRINSIAPEPPSIYLLRRRVGMRAQASPRSRWR